MITFSVGIYAKGETNELKSIISFPPVVDTLTIIVRQHDIEHDYKLIKQDTIKISNNEKQYIYQKLVNGIIEIYDWSLQTKLKCGESGTFLEIQMNNYISKYKLEMEIIHCGSEKNYLLDDKTIKFGNGCTFNIGINKSFEEIISTLYSKHKVHIDQ